MKLKSYFADSVEAAMGQASKELGGEAMLVYSREAPEEARYLGAYEVVFGVSGHSDQAGHAAGDEAGARRQRQATPNQAPAGAPAFQAMLTELAALRRQVGRISRVMTSVGGSGWNRTRLDDVIGELADTLSAAGLAPEVVQDLIGAISSSKTLQVAVDDPGAMATLRLSVRDQLAAMLRVDSRIGASTGGARVAVLVGPPGSGKTTTLVKLAASVGLKARHPVQLISMDMYRIGAAEQLRSFAAILGIGFQAVETAGALAVALEEHSQKELILIDTPGHSQKDFEASADLANFCSANPQVEVHLVLEASVKSADLRATVDRYDAFDPAKLVITKVDETASPGSVISEAIRTAKPVSFLTNGQQIPEDLIAATHAQLLDHVLGDDSQQLSEPDSNRIDSTISEPDWDQAFAGRAAAA